MCNPRFALARKENLPYQSRPAPGRQLAHFPPTPTMTQYLPTIFRFLGSAVSALFSAPARLLEYVALCLTRRAHRGEPAAITHATSPLLVKHTHQASHELERNRLAARPTRRTRRTPAFQPPPKQQPRPPRLARTTPRQPQRNQTPRLRTEETDPVATHRRFFHRR